MVNILLNIVFNHCTVNCIIIFLYIIKLQYFQSIFSVTIINFCLYHYFNEKGFLKGKGVQLIEHSVEAGESLSSLCLSPAEFQKAVV